MQWLHRGALASEDNWGHKEKKEIDERKSCDTHSFHFLHPIFFFIYLTLLVLPTTSKTLFSPFKSYFRLKTLHCVHYIILIFFLPFHLRNQKKI